MCPLTKIFIVVVSLGGDKVLYEVDREVVNKSVQIKLDQHQGCRKRNVGMCHSKLILHPSTGEVTYICNDPELV